jgi:hypothetical protein
MSLTLLEDINMNESNLTYNEMFLDGIALKIMETHLKNPFWENLYSISELSEMCYEQALTVYKISKEYKEQL